jgi:hypothetical protein
MVIERETLGVLTGRTPRSSSVLAHSGMEDAAGRYAVEG